MELPSNADELLNYTHCEIGCLLKIFLSRDIEILLYNNEKWKTYSEKFLQWANSKRTQTLWKTAIKENYSAKFVPIFINKINENEIENIFNKYINQIYFEVQNLESHKKKLNNHWNNSIKSYTKLNLPISSPNALPNSYAIVTINKLKQQLNKEKEINNLYIEHIKNEIPNRIKKIQDSKEICIDFVNKLKKCVEFLNI